MKAVRFLEQSKNIRYFGTLLCLAPIVNAGLYLYFEKIHANAQFQKINYWQILKQGSQLHYFLALCSLIIGLLMLSTGSRKTWKLVLALLGIHIFLQFKNIGINLKQSWLWGLFFVINAGIFVFIAEQLVFKVEPTKKKKLPRTVIGFKDTGPWAELMALNYKGIKVRSLIQPPQDIKNRVIHIKFKHGPHLSAKFEQASGNEFQFQFIDINKKNSLDLLNWIDKNAA